MKIDINYSEEKEVSHVGLYKRIECGSIYLFSDPKSTTCATVVLSKNYSENGMIFYSLPSCTRKELWSKLNADSVTFNLKD